MIKDDHFPNVGFVCRAFLYNVRFLLTHPVQSADAGPRSFLTAARAAKTFNFN